MKRLLLLSVLLPISVSPLMAINSETFNWAKNLVSNIEFRKGASAIGDDAKMLASIVGTVAKKSAHVSKNYLDSVIRANAGIIEVFNDGSPIFLALSIPAIISTGVVRGEMNKDKDVPLALRLYVNTLFAASVLLGGVSFAKTLSLI